MVLDALKKRLHDAAKSKGGKWIKVKDRYGEPERGGVNGSR
jgi:hypothetical protein